MFGERIECSPVSDFVGAHREAAARSGAFHDGSASSIGAAVLGTAVGLALDTQWQGAVLHGLRVYPVAAYRLVPLVLATGSLVAVIGLVLARETHAEQVPAPG